MSFPIHPNYRNDDERNYTRTYFFTDRGIYRPGQTVYFKGIKYQSDGKKKHRILNGANSTVTFYDTQNQVISTLNVTTNEFGTFSGSFTIPQGKLNGTMRIRDINGQKMIRVEEYKRPKFEVVFPKLETSYKLGEKVMVKGTAKAFSGASIDGAEVNYRVIRRPRWQIWRHFFRPAIPEETEITSGTLTTGNQGDFIVEFMALPDFNEDSASNPMYEFVVSADVTDMNGETHSASKSLTIGYTALIIQADIPEILENTSQNKFTLNTLNTEGNFEPVKGKITVYDLKEPEKVFRKRLWEAPDVFMYTKDEFYKLLPFDQYNHENDFTTWEKSRAVAEMSFNTGESKEIYLKEISKWPTGKYAVEIRSSDRFGKAVNQTTFFSLYSANGKKLLTRSLTFLLCPLKKQSLVKQSIILRQQLLMKCLPFLNLNRIWNFMILRKST
ncbi:MAG: hypothetical protein HC906_14795 [Bacteroidales bacterium]|nr:hypothetical protein [Bacteroidales bacterium]